MKKLIASIPNDQELGQVIRRSSFNDFNKALELLKETLSLHGFSGYGYPNGLIDRGEIYLEILEEKQCRWKNSCDGEKMDNLDQKIIDFLKSIDD